MQSINRYIAKLQRFIRFGDSIAGLSTCKRAKVGAVVFPCDCTAVYAIGYNGPVRGSDNDSCRDGEGNCGCAHAEGNAIAKLSAIKPSLIYCSTSPCEFCANMIINSCTIVGCICGSIYRDKTGLLKLLKRMRCLNSKGLNVDNVLEWWHIGRGDIGTPKPM